MDAFDVLYERYQPAILRFLVGRLGDPVLAEDVAQETMIRAMGSLDQFDGSRPLWPWMRTIAANASVDAIRRNGRMSALLSAVGSTAHVTTDRPEGLDAVLAERDVLRRALDEVPARQRQALERCYVDGYRPSDAATMFGVSHNAFDQLLHRARRNLRRAYHRQDTDSDAAGVNWAWLTAAPAGLVEWFRRLELPFGRVAEALTAGVAVAGFAVAVSVTGNSPKPATPGPQVAAGEAAARGAVTWPVAAAGSGASTDTDTDTEASSSPTDPGLGPRGETGVAVSEPAPPQPAPEAPEPQREQLTDAEQVPLPAPPDTNLDEPMVPDLPGVVEQPSGVAPGPSTGNSAPAPPTAVPSLPSTPGGTDAPSAPAEAGATTSEVSVPADVPTPPQSQPGN